ncbi:hypothetical protein BOFE_10060 (plasmid) [Candidatus Borrelia fainii]|uniref:DUF1640 domain-containing protein n=1 Tax=Candidatus Borrelia fainii TaxID=2518322 RepID=A0ABM8WWE1_9SPIR|nr:hypothetical protein [Candidatus Borrelia fainii]BDU63466.1 hypothetical protein BOFE_10060 [Candidatus Borrelia fainii]
MDIYIYILPIFKEMQREYKLAFGIDLAYRYYKNELKSDIKDLDNKIDVNKMELKSTLRLHGWMFGTLITLNIGIFLALMSLLVK